MSYLRRCRIGLRLVVVGESVEDVALFVPRFDVQDAFCELRRVGPECPLFGDAVVFRRFWFARGDGTVRILGLGSRVRGNDGVGLGDLQVRVFEGRGLRLTFALVPRKTSVVWEFVVRRVHVEYGLRVSIHMLEMYLVAYHR